MIFDDIFDSLVRFLRSRDDARKELEQLFVRNSVLQFLFFSFFFFFLRNTRETDISLQTDQHRNNTAEGNICERLSPTCIRTIRSIPKNHPLQRRSDVFHASFRLVHTIFSLFILLFEKLSIRDHRCDTLTSTYKTHFPPPYNNYHDCARFFRKTFTMLPRIFMLRACTP